MTEPASADPTGSIVDPGTLLTVSEHRMIVGLLSWLASLNRADQAHPRVRRWGLPALLVVFALPSLAKAAGGSGPGVPIVLALAIGFIVPLLWRERRPLPVFAVIAAVSVADIALGVMAGSNAARLVALYNVARLGTPAQLGFALAVGLPEAVATGLVVSADGPTSYLTQVPAMVTVMVVVTVAVTGLGLASRMARAYIAALEDRAVRLETERDQRARLAVAGERARIAREMHDILGHTLSVMVGLADGAAGLAETSPRRGADTLRIIAGSGRGALAELRRLLAVIRDDGEKPDDTPLAPQPGLADLDALLERVRGAGRTVTLHTEGDLGDLTPGVQLAVYRIVQEALTNTLKYAAPETAVTVALISDADVVHLTVEDTGPSAADPEHGGGRGLVGMRERAALYAGQITAGPNAQGGWTVRARLTPTAPAHSENRPA
ncbi:sensor histidine kinase [Streptomyces sp. NPDC058464]|uniref:sensor histidine kinase n=1 Tax=Streptomyces sp. NPDC058464 TaxID=3346511 RepID=UPI0036464F2C